MAAVSPALAVAAAFVPAHAATGSPGWRVVLTRHYGAASNNSAYETVTAPGAGDAPPRNPKELLVRIQRVRYILVGRCFGGAVPLLAGFVWLDSVTAHRAVSAGKTASPPRENNDEKPDERSRAAVIDPLLFADHEAFRRIGKIS